MNDSLVKFAIWCIIILSISVILAQTRRTILAEAQGIYIQGCKDTGASTQWCVENSKEFMKK
jgi:hypothetical protein